MFSSHQDLPSSAFCMSNWVRVQRIPPIKEANKTIRKPSRLNWVDLRVNMNRPLAISNTTRIRNGFCWVQKSKAGHITYNKHQAKKGVKSFNISRPNIPTFIQQKIKLHSWHFMGSLMQLKSKAVLDWFILTWFYPLKTLGWTGTCKQYWLLAIKKLQILLLSY